MTAPAAGTCQYRITDTLNGVTEALGTGTITALGLCAIGDAMHQLGYTNLLLSYITGIQPYYASHWIAVPFVARYIFLTCLLAITWQRGRARFQALAAFRASGRVSASDFYSIWYQQGGSSRWSTRAPLLIGMVAPVAIVIAIVIQANTGTDPRELLSHVAFMAAACYVMSFMTCVLWLQSRYLGRDELQIVD